VTSNRRSILSEGILFLCSTYSFYSE